MNDSLYIHLIFIYIFMLTHKYNCEDHVKVQKTKQGSFVYSILEHTLDSPMDLTCAKP